MTPAGKLLLLEMRALLTTLVERVAIGPDDVMYRKLDAIRRRAWVLNDETDLGETNG